MAVDRNRPFFCAEKITLLVIVDYYSRYLIVRDVKDETTATTIKHLENVFNTWYYPDELRCDNATTFESTSFQDFCSSRGILLVHSPPLHPEANGEVERQNEGILKCLRIAELEGKSYKVALENYVRTYNMTDHSVLNLPPFQMLTGMKPKFLFENVKESSFSIEDAKARNKIEKQKAKSYADKRRRARESDVRVGDTVLVWNNKPSSKITPKYFNKKFTVVSINYKSKSAMIQGRDNSRYRRSLNHLKRWNSSNPTVSTENEFQLGSDIQNENVESPAESPLIQSNSPPHQPSPRIRKSSRTTRKRERLIETCCVQENQD